MATDEALARALHRKTTIVVSCDQHPLEVNGGFDCDLAREVEVCAHDQQPWPCWSMKETPEELGPGLYMIGPEGCRGPSGLDIRAVPANDTPEAL